METNVKEEDGGGGGYPCILKEANGAEHWISVSGTILTLHLEIVLDSTLTALEVILELCDIILLPDTFLYLFCISLSRRKVSGRGSVPYLAE